MGESPVVPEDVTDSYMYTYEITDCNSPCNYIHRFSRLVSKPLQLCLNPMPHYQPDDIDLRASTLRLPVSLHESLARHCCEGGNRVPHRTWRPQVKH